jgi:hypothetical protein
MLREEVILFQKAAHKVALTIAWHNWQHGTLSFSEGVFQSVKLFLHWICILFCCWMYHVWCTSKISVFMYINTLLGIKKALDSLLFIYIFICLFFMLPWISYHLHVCCSTDISWYLIHGIPSVLQKAQGKSIIVYQKWKLHDTAIG